MAGSPDERNQNPFFIYMKVVGKKSSNSENFMFFVDWRGILSVCEDRVSLRLLIRTRLQNEGKMG